MATAAPQICETCSAPTNIACIKYWGKDLERGLNTPINSSVSVTLDQRDLRTLTTIYATTEIEADELWLNGERHELGARYTACVVALRKLAQERKGADGSVVVAAGDWPKYKLRVVSENNFPTAAGLASSAAGYACLVLTLSKLFCVDETAVSRSVLSTVARQGSGSACRSLFGGFVRWAKGSLADGTDSMAQQVAPASHWPEMRVAILVASADKKAVSSTSGMNTSVATSPLLRFRAESVVEPRLTKIEAAYLRRDFTEFGELTMRDSNQFHATCLDTFPPIFYLNMVSQTIIALVHAYNAMHGRVVAAYTFDAGPNAVLFCLEPDFAAFFSLLVALFPAPEAALGSYCNDSEFFAKCAASPPSDETVEKLVTALPGRERPARDLLAMMFSTRVGEGACAQPPSMALPLPAAALAAPEPQAA